MFGIDAVIIALVAAAVVLGIITWSLARVEQRRYEEVMRTGEREALQPSSVGREGGLDLAVALPRASEPGSAYAPPMPRAGAVGSPTERERRDSTGT